MNYFLDFSKYVKNINNRFISKEKNNQMNTIPPFPFNLCCQCFLLGLSPYKTMDKEICTMANDLEPHHNSGKSNSKTGEKKNNRTAFQSLSQNRFNLISLYFFFKIIKHLYSSNPFDLFFQILNHITSGPFYTTHQFCKGGRGRVGADHSQVPTVKHNLLQASSPHLTPPHPTPAHPELWAHV